MNRTLQVNYEPRLFRRVNTKLWRRQTPWMYQVVFGPIFIGAILAAFFFGKGTLVEWLLMAMFALIMFWPLISYVRMMLNTRRRVEKLEDRVMEYSFGDEAFSMDGPIGRAEIPWKHLGGIVELQEAWILQFPRNLWIIVPSHLLDNEIRGFLATKLDEANISKPSASQPPLYRINY